jgi:hypothetical protein
MLNQIPFYGSLLKKDLGKGRKSTQTHVLVYGAIESHAKGPKGCIVSNNKLSQEIGVSKSRVETVLSEISQAGWVSVHLDENNKRVKIIPNATITFERGKWGLPLTARGVAADGNIDSSLDSNTTYSAAEAAQPPKEKEHDSALKLFYLVVNKYGLPKMNNNNIRKWAKDIEAMPDGEAYLNQLLVEDLREVEGEFRPTLNDPYDIIAKKLKIQRFYNGGEDPVPRDPRVYG